MQIGKNVRRSFLIGGGAELDWCGDYSKAIRSPFLTIGPICM